MSRPGDNARIHPGDRVLVVKPRGLFARHSGGFRLAIPTGAIATAVRPTGSRRWMVRAGDVEVETSSQSLKALGAA